MTTNIPYKRITATLLSSAILSACGGGSSANISANDNQNSNKAQPTQIESQDWQGSEVLAREVRGDMTMTVEGSKLHINVNKMWRRNSGKHIQIFLDIDNNPATGFHSRYGLWSKSGIDYLIEDNRLYRSTSNDSRWRWKRVSDNVNYQHNGRDISFDVETSAFDGLCNSFTAGNMSRYRNWHIQSIYPISRKLKSYQVSSCSNGSDDIAPTIQLNGANPMSLSLNATFNDPGASASDNVDGNITSSIEVTSNVNTAIAGRYNVVYKVTDSSGNSAQQTRVVIVNEVTTPDGIVIDGNADDWAAIQPLSQTSNGVVKVFDDETKLYFLIKANNTIGANTQLFLDADKNTQTGFQLATQAWSGGADYMIENGSLGKATSNSAQWAWNFNLPATIETAKSAKVLEIAIKKSDIQALGNSFLLGFMSRNADWNINYIMPDSSLLTYQQLNFDTSNQAPIASDDAISINAGATQIIDVTANDTDSDGDTLVISSVGAAVNGTATLNADNTISYTANAGFSGTDNFNYVISDGQGHSATATVTVTVNTVNQAPTAVADTATTTGTATAIINVLSNDTDPDGDALSISSVGTAQNGTATISNNAISYTANAGFSGTDNFTYVISDGQGHNATATVTVTVNAANHAPIAVADTAATAAATATSINVLSNDTDADNDVLSISAVGSAQNGTTVISGNSIIYTPSAGFSGTDTFNYTITDGHGGSSNATVTVTVAPPAVNHAPDAVEDAPSTNNTQAITIHVLDNDTDQDGDTLTVTSITPPSFGTTTLNADGTVLFDPQGNIGSITFSYTISDGRGGSDTTVVTIASSDPTDGNNSFPDVLDDNVTTKVNTPITIDVLGNDTDADGDVLILDQVDSGSHGTTTKVNGKVLYTPVAGFTGTDTFYYGVHDGHGHNGSGLVTITITP